MSETRGPNSNTVCVSVLFNVLQQGGAGVHHGLEGVLAAGGDAFVRVEQDRQLPVRLVHLLPGDTRHADRDDQQSDVFTCYTC